MICAKVFGMRCYSHKRFVCSLSIFLLISGSLFPSLSFSTQNIDKSYSLSVVVHPQLDGTSDEISRNAAAALREALPHIVPMHIISPKIVENVLSYYKDVNGDYSSEKRMAVENLAQAKKHYFGFQYEVALAEVKRAIEILDAGRISENGAMLQDALLTQCLIAKAAGEKGLARKSLSRVITLNPYYQIDRLSYPPSIVELYQESRRQSQNQETGSLRVESNPRAAEVYINGIVQGVTPLNLSKLPVGAYTMLMKTNKYEPIEKIVIISKDKEVIIKEKLKWLDRQKSKKQKISDQAKSQIKEGIRIANLLKADKAILVNCEETSGKKMFFARMVDRKYRAAYKPLVVEYESSEERTQAIAEAAQVLAMQAKADILSNPQKYLDQEGLGDPVLLTKRKKELHKKPLFWGAIGTVAAGALAGGLAAVLVSGSSSETGSLAIRFK